MSRIVVEDPTMVATGSMHNATKSTALVNYQVFWNRVVMPRETEAVG